MGPIPGLWCLCCDLCAFSPGLLSPLPLPNSCHQTYSTWALQLPLSFQHLVMEIANSQFTTLLHTCGKELPWVPKSIFVLEVSLLLLNPVNGSPSAICYTSWYYKNHRMWAGNTMVMGKGAWGIKLIMMPLFSEKLCENKLGPSICFWLD